MSPEEYQEWSLQKSLQNYYRQKNSEAFENEGKNKFDFTTWQFDLGPAEKIFGPGGVRIKTQGSAELENRGQPEEDGQPEPIGKPPEDLRIRFRRENQHEHER